MIEQLFTVATGVCKNCHGGIRLMYGDLSGIKNSVWYHESGKNTCPKAPVAEPIEDTVKVIPEEDR